MKRHVKYSVVVLLVLLSFFSVAEAFAGTAFVNGVTADRVHLRSGPSRTSRSLGLYFTGTQVECFSDLSQEWVRVRIGQETGYMMSQYLYSGPDSDKLSKTLHYGQVTASGWLNLRQSPTTASRRLAKLYPDEMFTIFGETSTHWYYVLAAGQFGYVKGDYVTAGSNLSSPVGGSVTSTTANDSSFGSVLTGHASFYHVEAKRYLSLNEVGSQFTGAPTHFPAYASADVDRDGDPELILRQSVGGADDYGFLVLDRADGNIYGYEIPYRSMMTLKADGTFSFSSGASENGIGYAILDGSGFHIQVLASSAYDQKMGMQYYQNGLSVSEQVFEAAVMEYDTKSDAVWLSLMEETVVPDGI